MTPTAQPRLVFDLKPEAKPESLLDNLSAVTFSNGHLWVAGDECNRVPKKNGEGDAKRNTIERLAWNAETREFDRHTRYVVDEFVELPDAPKGEIDLEGLAIGGGYLWLIGSHSRAMRKPDRADGGKGAVLDHPAAIRDLRFSENKSGKNRHLIARIPMKGDELVRKVDGRTAAAVEFTEAGNILTDALTDDDHVGPYLTAHIPSKANGFDVEGLEYIDGRLFLGLRGPVLLEYGFVIEIEPKETDSKGVLGLKKIGPGGERYRKHFLHLHGRGVRDLTRDGDDLLVLAGPSMRLDAPAAVYRLRDVADLPDAVLHEPDFEGVFPFAEEGQDVPRGGDHAEGLTIAELDGKRQLVVLYDSPSGDRVSTNPPAVTADLFDV